MLLLEAQAGVLSTPRGKLRPQTLIEKPTHLDSTVAPLGMTLTFKPQQTQWVEATAACCRYSMSDFRSIGGILVFATHFWQLEPIAHISNVSLFAPALVCICVPENPHKMSVLNAKSCKTMKVRPFAHNHTG